MKYQLETINPKKAIEEVKDLKLKGWQILVRLRKYLPTKNYVVSQEEVYKFLEENQCSIDGAIKTKKRDMSIEASHDRHAFSKEQILIHEVKNSFVGLVVKMGDGAFKSENYKELGPQCKVGDYVLYQKIRGYRLKYKDNLYLLLQDSAIDLVIDDPKFYTK